MVLEIFKWLLQKLEKLDDWLAPVPSPKRRFIPHANGSRPEDCVLENDYCLACKRYPPGFDPRIDPPWDVYVYGN